MLGLLVCSICVLSLPAWPSTKIALRIVSMYLALLACVTNIWRRNKRSVRCCCCLIARFDCLLDNLYAAVQVASALLLLVCWLADWLSCLLPCLPDFLIFLAALLARGIAFAFLGIVGARLPFKSGFGYARLVACFFAVAWCLGWVERGRARSFFL